MRLDDEDLLRRCQQGDESAMEILVQRFQDRIYRLACQVLRDSARAEEAAVDALAAVWNRCGSWRGESRAGTWIHAVALRMILDHQRARRRWWRFRELDSTSELLPSAAQNVPDMVSDCEERRLLAKKLSAALERLSVDDRALVHLHYYEGLSLAEVAEILGVSRDALKMRLSRVRQKLRWILETCPSDRNNSEQPRTNQNNMKGNQPGKIS